MKTYYAIPLCLVLLVGCGLDDTQKAVLSSGAVASKERASAFAAVLNAGKIVAKNPADAQAVASWATSHSAGLNAEAAALNSLLTAANTGSKLSDSARTQLAAEADTASARADGLAAMLPLLNCDAPTTQFLTDHQAGLVSLAAAIATISASLQPSGTPTPAPTN